MAELEEAGLRRRTRLVSGPQGAHVMLDGHSVLLLCSNNYLGLADLGDVTVTTLPRATALTPEALAAAGRELPVDP